MQQKIAYVTFNLAEIKPVIKHYTAEVSEHKIFFIDVDKIEHTFYFLKDKIVLEKNGHIQTRLIFSLSKKTNFIYYLKAANTKIFGKLTTNKITKNQNLIEIHYTTKIDNQELNGIIKIIL